MTTIADLDARYYRGYPDEHTRFDAAVRRHLREGHLLLDAGAGSGSAYRYDYREWVGRVVGADRRSAIGGNPNLDDAVVADLARLPFRDGAFDVVLAKYVFEHLARPEAVLAETRRVLKRGGCLVFHTPNRFHYYALAARVTPHRFHEWFNRKRGVTEGHSFETHFRANDRRTLERLARRTGFRVLEMEMFEPRPAYLFFSTLLYRVGIAYERLVRRYDALRGVRANIIGVLEAA